MSTGTLTIPLTALTDIDLEALIAEQERRKKADGKLMELIVQPTSTPSTKPKVPESNKSKLSYLDIRKCLRTLPVGSVFTIDQFKDHVRSKGFTLGAAYARKIGGFLNGATKQGYLRRICRGQYEVIKMYDLFGGKISDKVLALLKAFPGEFTMVDFHAELKRAGIDPKQFGSADSVLWRHVRTGMFKVVGGPRGNRTYIRRSLLKLKQPALATTAPIKVPNDWVASNNFTGAVEFKNGNKVWIKDGNLHRDGDLPAIIYAEGDQAWYQNGQLQREGDQPVYIWADGSKGWFKDDKQHRDGDLPAIIYADGRKAWYKNDQLHRDGDLPAVIWADGTQAWYKAGQRHREGDKPAYTGADGTRRWFKHGVEYTPKKAAQPVDPVPIEYVDDGTVWFRKVEKLIAGLHEPRLPDEKFVGQRFSPEVFKYAEILIKCAKGGITDGSKDTTKILFRLLDAKKEGERVFHRKLTTNDHNRFEDVARHLTQSTALVRVGHGVYRLGDNLYSLCSKTILSPFKSI